MLSGINLLKSGSLFFSCVPIFHLAMPIFGFIVLIWLVIVLTGTKKTDINPIVLLIILFAAAGVALAIPMFGIISVIIVLVYYVIAVLAVGDIAQEKWGIVPNIAIVILGLGLPFIVVKSLTTSDITASTIIAVTVFLKISLAILGLVFLRTFIRKTGIEKLIRRRNLILQGIVLLVLLFLLFIYRFFNLYDSNLNLYIHVLKTGWIKFAVLSVLLAVGAGIFFNEERNLAGKEAENED